MIRWGEKGRGWGMWVGLHVDKIRGKRGRPAAIWSRTPAAAVLTSIFAGLVLAGCIGADFAAAAPGRGGLSAGLPQGARTLVVPVAVFGRDDRVSLPASHRALARSIGLLYEERSQTVCTAFCVGPKTIATAGHCLFGTEGEAAPRLAGFTFRLPGVSPVPMTRISGTEKGSGAQFVTSGTTRLNVNPPIDAAADWALVRLADPVCAGHELPVSRSSTDDVDGLAAEDRIYQVSFHRDFDDWKLAYDRPCGLVRPRPGAEQATINQDFARPDDVLFHTCDTGGASSGSPLLIDGPQGAEVVGINVGTYVRAKIVTQAGEVVHRYKSESIANTGVAAHVFAGRLDGFERAQIIDGEREMRGVQTLLRELGLYAGPRDGIYGRDLRAAIERFETREGRSPTGLATRDLAARIGAMRDAERALALERSAPVETGSIGAHQQSRGRARVR